jgi:hypothetical protein
MSDQIRMRARTRLTTADGRSIAPDTLFSTTPVDAAALTYRGRALFASSSSEPSSSSRKKRTYKRRDLRAES